MGQGHHDIPDNIQELETLLGWYLFLSPYLVLACHTKCRIFLVILLLSLWLPGPSLSGFGLPYIWLSPFPRCPYSQEGK